MIVRKETLAKAIERLKSLFLEQVENGNQSKIVKSNNPVYFSLGQFLNDSNRTQRGVHGTANGLRVIAECGKDELVNGMVRYLESRRDVEKGINQAEKSIADEKLNDDEKNTIKLSETLYSLHFVKAASSQKEHYIGRVKNVLVAGLIKKVNDTGWDYYVDDKKTSIEILPTAFAILALGINGYEVAKQSDSLLEKLKVTEINDPAKFSEIVFGLYSLLIGTSDYENNEKSYKEILNKIWNSPYRVMNNLIEQNLEYWHGDQHHYIRIPWQIYLLAILSSISDKKFYSISSQRLLKNMVDLVVNDSFRYQYSGHYISSRTNAILCDTLIQIKQNIKQDLQYKILVSLDAIRIFLGSRFVKFVLILIGLTFISTSIFSWLKLNRLGEKEFSEVAPEFIVWIVLGLIALGKKK